MEFFLFCICVSFRSIPRHCKYRDPEYEAYIDHLLNYLKVFFQKINPLSNNLKVF
jgi:hypothetical protein